LQNSKIAEAIERSLASAPPMTPEQIRRISGLMRTGAPYLPPEPVSLPPAEPVVDIKKLQRDLSQCAGCGVSKAGHFYNDSYHDFTPISKEDAMKILDRAYA